MIKFIRRIAFLGSLIAVALCVNIGIRILWWQPKVAALLHNEPWQKILFVGDSHIGCTFIENRQYCNRTVWAAALPHQFALIWLLDMERLGTLAGVNTVVIDIGNQSFAEQEKSLMMTIWQRQIPISWRYSRMVPLGLFDKISGVVRCSEKIAIMEGKISTNDIPITSRTINERDADFAHNAYHFGWSIRPEKMCAGWNRSLSEAIDEIIAVCKRNNVRLVFFTAPLTTYYRAAMLPSEKQILRRYTDRIASSGVEYYDLSEWCADNEFRDCHHLTYSGAKRFTERFFKEILRP